MRKKKKRKDQGEKQWVRDWVDDHRLGDDLDDLLGEGSDELVTFDDWLSADDARSPHDSRFGFEFDPDRWRDDLLERASRRERMRRSDVRRGIL